MAGKKQYVIYIVLLPSVFLLKLGGWVAETRQYYPGVYLAGNRQEDKIETFIISAWSVLVPTLPLLHNYIWITNAMKKNPNMFRKGKNTERITFYSVSQACKESIHLNALTFGNGEKYFQRGQNLQHLTASKSKKG